MKKFLLCWAVLCGALALGCVQAERRGVLDGAYISTARPAISVRAAQLPLLGNGRWHIQLADTDMVGGLPVRVWLAVYGAGAPQGPLAIVAHAEVPQGWFWDGASRRPFSVDPGVELLGDVGFQASTAIVRGPRDPFAAFAGADADKSGQPAAWLVRQFAARANFDRDKIVLEYREPLPAELADQPTLEIPGTDLLRAFEQRAREAFVVGPAPADGQGAQAGTLPQVRWQDVDQNFLGTVSRQELLQPR